MANNYHLLDATVNATATAISGRFLAHTHEEVVVRAFMAVDLHRGATQLVMPTMSQAARLARVNATYAWWANRRLGERLAIEAGLIPLVPPHATAPKMKALPAPSEIPDDGWSAAKDLVAKYGPGVVFDQLIAPALA